MRSTAPPWRATSLALTFFNFFWLKSELPQRLRTEHAGPQEAGTTMRPPCGGDGWHELSAQTLLLLSHTSGAMEKTPRGILGEAELRPSEGNGCCRTGSLCCRRGSALLAGREAKKKKKKRKTLTNGTERLKLSVHHLNNNGDADCTCLE